MCEGELQVRTHAFPFDPLRKPHFANKSISGKFSDNLELESINRINNGEILEVLRSATFTDLFIQTDKGNLIRSWKSIIEEHAEKCDTDEM